MTQHKKIAIMQPYFLPYIGYWQLIDQADEFVVYDTIEYTKKGWINRNRFLQNGKDVVFSIPLKKDSDYLYIKDREVSDSFDREKLIRQLHGAYHTAPYYKENFPVVKDIIGNDNKNLFNYIYNSIECICVFLDIKTPLITSSDINSGFEDEKGQAKVINICKTRQASIYINPIGGLDLYNAKDFQKNGLDLKFLKARAQDYQTFGQAALPHMSIVDVMMFNSRDSIINTLQDFDWIDPQ